MPPGLIAVLKRVAGRLTFDAAAAPETNAHAAASAQPDLESAPERRRARVGTTAEEPPTYRGRTWKPPAPRPGPSRGVRVAQRAAVAAVPVPDPTPVQTPAPIPDPEPAPVQVQAQVPAPEVHIAAAPVADQQCPSAADPPEIDAPLGGMSNRRIREWLNGTYEAMNTVSFAPPSSPPSPPPAPDRPYDWEQSLIYDRTAIALLGGFGQGMRRGDCW